MKKLLPTSFVVLLITTFAFACQSFSSKSITADTKELNIQPFTELSVSGSFEVLFTQEANTTARAEGSAEDLEKIMIDDYIVRRKAIKRRIEEQLVTGNITYEDGQVNLNKQGEGFLNLCRIIRTVFKLPDRSKVEE